jgi:hypothetical protein
MNSISVSIYLQEEPVVCPQCGSTVRLAHDVCLRCMLLLGIAACGDTSETLDDLLSEIDVQDAECRAKAGIRMRLNSSGGQTCPDYSGY